jgi:hypothetical protein
LTNNGIARPKKPLLDVRHSETEGGSGSTRTSNCKCAWPTSYETSIFERSIATGTIAADPIDPPPIFGFAKRRSNQKSQKGESGQAKVYFNSAMFTPELDD